MPDLRVSLLGAPRATVGRTPIVTDTRKATALLAYPRSNSHSVVRSRHAVKGGRAEGPRRAARTLPSFDRPARSVARGGRETMTRPNSVRVDVVEFRQAIRGVGSRMRSACRRRLPRALARQPGAA